jgi:NADH-quinone oxidoreductase subunit D
VKVDDPRITFPSKQDVYTKMESLIHHFKLFMNGHGIMPPKGEVYQPVEGANGELGFYVVSDGSGRPYRLRCRGPCFMIMSGVSRMINGGMVADIVPTFGSVNMIGGECDR